MRSHTHEVCEPPPALGVSTRTHAPFVEFGGFGVSVSVAVIIAPEQTTRSSGVAANAVVPLDHAVVVATSAVDGDATPLAKVPPLIEYSRSSIDQRFDTPSVPPDSLPLREGEFQIAFTAARPVALRCTPTHVPGGV